MGSERSAWTLAAQGSRKQAQCLPDSARDFDRMHQAPGKPKLSFPGTEGHQGGVCRGAQHLVTAGVTPLLSEQAPFLVYVLSLRSLVDVSHTQDTHDRQLALWSVPVFSGGGSSASLGSPSCTHKLQREQQNAAKRSGQMFIVGENRPQQTPGLQAL